MTAEQPEPDRTPIVYVYDRHAYDRETADNVVELQKRLEGCAKYAAERGWDFGGWWLDKGDDALADRRPAFDALLRTAQAAGDRPRICLVHDWGRLSHDREARERMIRRVLLAGGSAETCDGERRTPGDGQIQVGRPTPGPVTA